MSKKLLFISILMLVITAVIVLSYDRKPSVLVAGEERIEEIKEGSKPLDEEFVLFYDGEPLPYYEANKTFYLPVDMYDIEWESAKFSGCFYKEASEAYLGAEGEIPDGRQADLLFVQSYKETNKSLSIATGREFPFLAITGKGYGEYKLVFTGLPMMLFTGTEYVAEDGSQMFLLRLYETDHEGSFVTRCYTQARLRGNTSLAYDKKSLRLNLKELQDGVFEKKNANLLGLRDDDDWILNALYADNTRIRDQLCIDLWQQVGAGNNPYGQIFGTQSAMVEVVIGTGYQGIYDLMVPIDAKQLGMDAVSDQMAAGQPVIERLYKKKYTAQWNASDFMGELPDPKMPDYRGGFYIKGDTILQNEEEWEPLYRMASLIEGEDDVFAAEITDAADQQNIIDNWLFFQAIAGVDNENKNIYYAVRNRNGNAYGYFIPWDMNNSFGAFYADNMYYSEEKEEGINALVKWQPGQRMIELDVEGSRALAYDTWQNWRAGPFSNDALYERLRGLERQVKDSGAFSREAARWPEGNQDQNFAFLYDFTIKRMAFLDAYMEELAGRAGEE
ncbi:MAG: CotH kinase family protein [Lachnospiraceae bacterium]|nr:CotH kinase family protein [Lachnospiraceae bacterium]